jgi:hypothetical protein
MNVVLRIKPSRHAASVAHSITTYDRVTESLVSELAVPPLLDALALRIAEVPAEDPYGAASYRLPAKAVGTFRFLLGLDVDLQTQDCFLEAWPRSASVSQPAKRKVLGMLSRMSPRPCYDRGGRDRISEGELVLPTLRLLGAANGTWMRTTELIRHLTKLLTPSGPDAQVLPGRCDPYVSQAVRNMVSHRKQPGNVISLGLAEYDPARHALRISSRGRAVVRALRS